MNPRAVGPSIAGYPQVFNMVKFTLSLEFPNMRNSQFFRDVSSFIQFWLNASVAFTWNFGRMEDAGLHCAIRVVSLGLPRLN
jgi:hypothetical protein